MTLTREISNSHPISTLKKEISKTNIKGYSKMKKNEVVELMMKNKERFNHIKMAERVRKTKDVKPKSAPKPKSAKVVKVVRRTTADGEKVLVTKPVKTGSTVYEATGDNDRIGTWDDEKKTVIPIPSSSSSLRISSLPISSPPKSSPPSSPPKSSPPEIPKDFLAAIAKGEKVAERVRKTKDIMPPPKIIAETKASPNFTQKDLKTLDPLTVFAQLPTELKGLIGNMSGEEFINAWNEGKQLKGFKALEMKKKLKKVQTNIFKQLIGKKVFYTWKTPQILVTALRRDKNLIKAPGIMSQLFDLLTKTVKNEIKVLKPKQPKAKAPLTEEQEKKRREAVTVRNMYNLIDDYDLRADDYESNVMDNLAWMGYKGATLGSTEDQTWKLMERIGDVASMRYKRALNQFLKDTKPKPKTLPDAMEKFKAWVQKNYEGNIAKMMDDYEKDTDLPD